MGENLTYSGLSSDLGGTGTALTVKVGLDWVVKEQSVLIEVILGFFFSHPDGLGECLSRGLYHKSLAPSIKEGQQTKALQKTVSIEKVTKTTLKGLNDVKVTSVGRFRRGKIGPLMPSVVYFLRN